MDKIVNTETINFVMENFRKAPFNTVIYSCFILGGSALAFVAIDNANIDGSSLNKIKFAFDSYFLKS